MSYAEVSRTVGQTFVYKHVSDQGLVDVKINIFNSLGALVVSNQTMTELANGIYTYIFTPTSEGTYTGLMSSVTGNSKSVIDAAFIVPVVQSTTVISNTVGVGHSD